MHFVLKKSKVVKKVKGTGFVRGKVKCAYVEKGFSCPHFLSLVVKSSPLHLTKYCSSEQFEVSDFYFVASLYLYNECHRKILCRLLHYLG